MIADKARRIATLVRCYNASRERLLAALRQCNAREATETSGETANEALADAKRYLLQLRLLAGWSKALGLIDGDGVLEPDEITLGR